jgi:hypothetical protein
MFVYTSFTRNRSEASRREKYSSGQISAFATGLPSIAASGRGKFCDFFIRFFTFYARFLHRSA